MSLWYHILNCPMKEILTGIYSWKMCPCYRFQTMCYSVSFNITLFIANRSRPLHSMLMFIPNISRLICVIFIPVYIYHGVFYKPYTSGKSFPSNLTDIDHIFEGQILLQPLRLTNFSWNWSVIEIVTDKQNQLSYSKCLFDYEAMTNDDI